MYFDQRRQGIIFNYVDDEEIVNVCLKYSYVIIIMKFFLNGYRLVEELQFNFWFCKLENIQMDDSFLQLCYKVVIYLVIFLFIMYNLYFFIRELQFYVQLQIQNRMFSQIRIVEIDMLKIVIIINIYV